MTGTTNCEIRTKNLKYLYFIFFAVIAILLGLTAYRACYYKNVAEASLEEAKATLVLAQKGKTFYLLHTDGNCQQVTIRFNGDRPVWINGMTLVGIKKPSGTFVKSETDQFECQLSVAMALH